MKNLIVAVDNDPDTLETYQALFDMESCRSLVFLSGEKLLSSKLVSSVQLALLDYSINDDMNGIEVFQAMRKVNNTFEGVLVTGHSEFDIAVKALKVGFADYIVKPLELEVMQRLCKLANQGSESLAQAERRLILTTLNACNGDLTRTAQKLSITIQKLNYRLKEYQRS